MEASNNKKEETKEKEIFDRLPEWCKIILNLSKKRGSVTSMGNKLKP